MPSTLRLIYADGRGPYTLNSASDDSPEGEFVVTVNTIYQEENGSVTGLGETELGQFSVKAALTDETRQELRTEADIYSTLPKEYKGDIFPYIRGYYEGEGIACLLLEPLDIFDHEEKLITLPLEERYKFLTQLGRMHKIGYLPTLDLGGGNLGIARDKAIRIGHLKELKKHKCPWNGEWNFGQPAPSLEDFKCASLYEAGKETGIWTATLPTVRVGNETFLTFAATTTVTYDDE